MGYDLFIAIGSGVVSGLVATFLTFVAARYWTKVIVPWYEDRVYKDIKIAGEWDTQGDEHGDTFHEIAKVSQQAHRIWGDIIYQSPGEIINYEFEGEFRNLILTGRYWVKGRNDLDRGTFTLMLRENGKVLKGFYAWYLGDENDVVSGWYKWIRKS
ncbi:MAG: hypothetical protein FJ110_18635 [Deltaproteobacteria bacterium]|nr:hypothetical protein [Deltaproteobacteria bacterium]